MVTEQYVSFETAKLLKEKGFDAPVYRFYDDEGVVCEKHIESQSKCKSWTFPCPTQQMALRWLRERWDVYVEISIDYPQGFRDNKHRHIFRYTVYNGNVDCMFERDGFATYEDAAENVIVEILKR